MVTSNLIETLVKLTWFLFVLFMATPGLGQLLYGLPSEVKTAVRRFEKCSLKITRANCSVAYTGTCGSKCQWGSECQVAKLYRFCLTNGVEQCTLNFK